MGPPRPVDQQVCRPLLVGTVDDRGPLTRTPPVRTRIIQSGPPSRLDRSPGLGRRYSCPDRHRGRTTDNVHRPDTVRRGLGSTVESDAPGTMKTVGSPAVGPGNHSRQGHGDWRGPGTSEVGRTGVGREETSPTRGVLTGPRRHGSTHLVRPWETPSGPPVHIDRPRVVRINNLFTCLRTSLRLVLSRKHNSRTIHGP